MDTSPEIGPDNNPDPGPGAGPDTGPVTPDAAESDARRRRTAILTVIGVVVVLLFAVVVAVGVQRTPAHPAEAARPTSTPTTPPVAGPPAPVPGVVIPSGATAYGVTFGKVDAPVAIDLYIDFQCPFCRQFELGSGATLNQMIATGQARVTYHPLSFFDRFSSTRYSSRAASAAGCAIDAHVYPKFQQLLFEQQPPEGGVGLPDEKIIALGRQAGAGAQFDGCVREQRYAPWVTALTTHATDAGVDSTPDLQVNGDPVDHTDQDLRQAVTSATR